MALSIREADAKRLLGDLSRPCVLISAVTDYEKVAKENPWLQTSKLVVKPDVLLKRRGKSGLVKLNVSWPEAAEFLKANMDKEMVMEGLNGVMDHFIVEQFFPHCDQTNEMYIAIRTLRLADEILFSSRGGVNVGDVESHARKLQIPVDESGAVPQVNFGSLFDDVKDPAAKAALPGFVQRLYAKFCEMHFAFLELNPISYDASKSSFVVLDSAAKVDHTSEFVVADKWGHLEFPSPFGRAFSKEEQYIRDLDAKSGASLKLTVLNPKGRIWTLVAGGGASVVYSDTVCDYGMAHELANYGEYSGAPSDSLTYEYAKTVLGLMVADGTYRPEGKILLIGGGIANFTSVADTFRGIIKAMRELKNKLLEFKVRIYVRRGGPNYQEGLKMMKDVGEELGLPMKVFGPETYVTAIIPLALADDGGPQAEHLMKSATLPRIKTWKDSDGDDGDVAMSNSPESLPSAKRCRLVSSEQKENENMCANGNTAMVDDVKKTQKILFTKDTQCFVWGLQERACQEMLDFDHVCGRKTPSVAAIIYEFSVSHLRPFYFGTEEVFVPVYQTLQEAVEKHPNVDTMVNFASMRSADKVTKMCLECPQFKTIAIIAEGIPERNTREFVVSAIKKGVTIIGPATVGGIKPGCFRVGNTGGRLENIMNSKLYRPGCVAFVSKSGGMLNEMNNILRMVCDGSCEGVAIGGDRFPGTTMMDHIMRFQEDPKAKIIVMLGEVGGDVEYEVAKAVKDGRITKPVVGWCVGTCAGMFTTEVSFGHAGAWAGSASETAAAKNQALKEAGVHVPASFQELGNLIAEVYAQLVQEGVVQVLKENDAPRVPMDYKWAKKLGLVRKPKGFVSSISDDRGEELVYAGFPISKVLQSEMGVGGVISLLWFKRPLPDYCYRYLEMVLMLTADHGPAVCGAHNTIVTARAGKDLISCLISGLCTIGDRFGGACDQAAQQFLGARDEQMSPEQFVKHMKDSNKLIMGIGHKIKTVNNPDMRVQLLKRFCKSNFAKTDCISFAEGVEAVTTRKKDTLILNVDGLMGASMVDLLFGCGAFSDQEARDYIANGCINGLFVLGRTIGFIGHYLDQKRLKQGLYRHDVDDIAYVLPDLGRA